MSQILSKKGPWVDGCVVLQGDTAALSVEVVSGDNAHSDNQQGPGRRDPGHWAQPQGQLTGHVAVCSKEISSPRRPPISADQARKMHTQAGLDTGVPTRLQGVH